MSEVKLNLWQKINAVMKDVEYLSKDDQVKFGTTNYKAISEEKVTSTVRDSLVKNGLIIMPVEQEHFKVDNLSTVNVKYKIMNMDNPQEFEIVASSGTGVDTQDKGVGKAMTYAYKYMLLRTFAIPTGEDPDKISSAELDEKLNASKSNYKAPGAKENKSDINGQASGKLSDKQVNRAIAIGKSKGITLANIKAKILTDYKKAEIADLTKEQYEELCTRLENAGGK